jgi:hypothetical protein
MRSDMEISVPTWSEDYKLFEEVVNAGIDSRLEGFTKSIFFTRGGRLYLVFRPSEYQILIRRLLEIGTDLADQWVDGIVEIIYGVEVV